MREKLITHKGYKNLYLEMESKEPDTPDIDLTASLEVKEPLSCPATCPQRAGGITFYFSKQRKVHLDPLEIICLFLLCFPVSIMVREASKTTFEDSLKRIAYLSGCVVFIRKMPTSKFYEKMLSVSLFDEKS